MRNFVTKPVSVVCCFAVAVYLGGRVFLLDFLPKEMSCGVPLLLSSVSNFVSLFLSMHVHSWRNKSISWKNVTQSLSTKNNGIPYITLLVAFQNYD